MTGDGAVDAGALSRLWDAHWPECLPVAHLLRSHFRDRWVRFHSLPLSKRYADTDAEYDVVMTRHNTVISELTPGTAVLVITTEYAGDGELTEFWRTREGVLPDASVWRDVPHRAERSGIRHPLQALRF